MSSSKNRVQFDHRKHIAIGNSESNQGPHIYLSVTSSVIRLWLPYFLSYVKGPHSSLEVLDPLCESIHTHGQLRVSVVPLPVLDGVRVDRTVPRRQRRYSYRSRTTLRGLLTPHGSIYTGKGVGSEEGGRTSSGPLIWSNPKTRELPSCRWGPCDPLVLGFPSRDPLQYRSQST